MGLESSRLNQMLGDMQAQKKQRQVEEELYQKDMQFKRYVESQQDSLKRMAEAVAKAQQEAQRSHTVTVNMGGGGGSRGGGGGKAAAKPKNNPPAGTPIGKGYANGSGGYMGANAYANKYGLPAGAAVPPSAAPQATPSRPKQGLVGYFYGPPPTGKKK